MDKNGNILPLEMVEKLKEEYQDVLTEVRWRGGVHAYWIKNNNLGALELIFHQDFYGSLATGRALAFGNNLGTFLNHILLESLPHDRLGSLRFVPYVYYRTHGALTDTY